MKVLILLAILGVAAASPFARNLVKQFPERIVGGSAATKGQFPYIVQITRSGSQYCGGSIVNANWILTAAHCSVATIAGYTVVAGQHFTNVNEGTEQSRSVSSITRHPNYNSNTLANDLAVWRVSASFVFGTYVSAATLASSDPSGDVTVAGWGTTSSGGSISNTLLHVSVPMVSDASCKSSYGSSEILSGMICAGTGGRDSCQGDSGGPLVQSGSQHGIVSWGYGCAVQGYPGVYTSVAYFRAWILANTA